MCVKQNLNWMSGTNSLRQIANWVYFPEGNLRSTYILRSYLSPSVDRNAAWFWSSFETTMRNETSLFQEIALNLTNISKNL